MNATKKIVLGLGIASGTVLAAWLMTGERSHKTKSYVVRSARHLKNNLKTHHIPFDDSEVHYI